MTAPSDPTQVPQKNTQRYMSVECGKLIASIFIVFVHMPFPGTFGSLVSCLAKFAVPLFFMISGYFNYQASSKTVLRRLKHIASLIIKATLLYIFWDCIKTELAGGSTIAYLRAAIPDPIEVVNWIVMFVHPYVNPLWYLIAIAACYLVFWLYTQFWEGRAIHYRPFYFLCLNLFLFYFLLGIVTPVGGWDAKGLDGAFGWAQSISMFGIGLFIREYQDRILSCYHLTAKKLLLIILVGTAFTILQWSVMEIRFLPFGLVIVIPALMLLMVSHPDIPVKSPKAKKLILSFGPLSTWIYITHMLFYFIYFDYCQGWFVSAFGQAEPWIQPFFTLILSVILSALCVALENQAKRLRKKKTA